MKISQKRNAHATLAPLQKENPRARKLSLSVVPKIFNGRGHGPPKPKKKQKKKKRKRTKKTTQRGAETGGHS